MQGFFCIFVLFSAAGIHRCIPFLLCNYDVSPYCVTMLAPQTPQVSVTIPAYNAASTLAVAVDSILAQTFTDFELIIVDDGSTDHTADIIRQYVAADSRVRGFTIIHSGVSVAANVAISEARADLVARMDADDYSHPERLAKQVAYMHGHPEIGIVGTLVEFGGDRESAGGYARHVDWANSLVTPEEISLHRFQESPLPNPSTMFRRELFYKYGGYIDKEIPEDYELWLRWMSFDVQVGKIPEKLVVWNDPPTRLSRTSEACSIENFYKVKTPYLATWLIDNVEPEKAIYVIGAGKMSRQRALLLEESGIVIAGWIDVDPKKIGNIVNGKRVYGRPVLKEAPCFAVAYLAGHDANEQLLEFLNEEGLVMGKDYILAS